MEKLSESFLSDGRLLNQKFDEADGFISAGELSYEEFSSQLVRKVIYFQLELSKEKVRDRYDEKKVEKFRLLARHFLAQLKDGLLTEAEQQQVSKQLKTIFPRFHTPKAARKNLSKEKQAPEDSGR